MPGAFRPETVLGGNPNCPDFVLAWHSAGEVARMWIPFRFLMGLAVIACIGASATFAFEFGWTRGATEVYRWTYAIAGVALDLFKSGLPILGATAWHDTKPARSFACWVVFIVLTGLSLWCAYGTTATQLAEKFANQAVAQSDLSTRQATLDRLQIGRAHV